MENYKLNKVSDSAYIVNKDGKDEYKLTKVNGFWSCTCTGYYYHGTCKHIDMLKGKVADSEIGLVDEIHTLGEIDKIKQSLEETLSNNYKYTLSGDYRRDASVVTTLPIVVECNEKEFGLLLNALDKERFKATLTSEEVIRGYYDRVPTIFIRVNAKNAATALLSTTGSKDENARLRKIAKIKGWKLLENGLYDSNNKLIDTPTEQSIYELLGEKYKEPRMR